LRPRVSEAADEEVQQPSGGEALRRSFLKEEHMRDGDRQPVSGKGVRLRAWRRGDLDDAGSWRDACLNMAGDAIAERRFTVEDDAGRVVGMVAIADIRESERTAYSMVSCFAPEVHDRGLDAEAVRVALRWCFDEQGLMKVYAPVAATDASGLQRYVACGFRKAWEFWQPTSSEAGGAGEHPRLDRSLSYVKAETRKTYVRYALMVATASGREEGENS